MLDRARAISVNRERLIRLVYELQEKIVYVEDLQPELVNRLVDLLGKKTVEKSKAGYRYSSLGLRP